MKKLLFTLSIFLGITTSLFAQSEYVSGGQNTFGTSVGFQANSSSMPGFVTFSTGFGMRGEFDLGFKIGVSNMGKIYAPFFNLILRPRYSKSDSPFTFTFFVQPEFYSSSTISSKSSITVGSTMFIDARMSRNTFFRPYILGAYTNGTPDGTFTKGGGFSFFHKGKKIIPVFKIGLFTNQNNTSGVVSFSIVRVTD